MIYARTKNALEQILPLLAGLTSLDPSKYPPQDLEAIRTVVTTELTELVDELKVPGGPRIQRVNDLFSLLLGPGTGQISDPDLVQGQLGTLRERFALTVDEVNTLEEERIATNFRVVVEQVMALRTSWDSDRRLLSRTSPKSSLGTILILLSRSLDAVGESVDDLNFALDSVFVDAAQRQVIEIPIRNEPPILLSDLLDWVVRASRDEGPRLIQDAGKDGVFAFAPVLRRLRNLVRDTRQLATGGGGLPAGLRTPRVVRALDVLVKQLDDAAGLASSVRAEQAPEISAAWLQATRGLFRKQGEQFSASTSAGNQVLYLLGSNFQDGATVALSALGRTDIPETYLKVEVIQPSLAVALLSDPPWRDHPSTGLTWLVSLANQDGTRSNQVVIDPDVAP